MTTVATIDKLRKQKRCKPIVQLSITGQFLNLYYSISEAHRQTGVSRTAICNALAKSSGLQLSGGYIWKYSKDFIPDELP